MQIISCPAPKKRREHVSLMSVDLAGMAPIDVHDSETALTFVHLSDIHFREDRTDTQYDEVQADLRNEIELNLQALFCEVDATGILVTGDIAFAGREAEYKSARAWFEKLSGIVRCGVDGIWVVPGNHDVDRSLIARSPSLQSAHLSVRAASADEAHSDDALNRYLTDPAFGNSLLSPMQEYMKFARLYGCEISKDSVCWNSPFIFHDGTTLQMRGLTSTLISDGADAEGNLVLGSVQSIMQHHPGVVNMTLCHHPPDWLMHGTAIESRLNARVKVQLFGHRHRFVAGVTNQCVVIVAGATHPDPLEAGWDPRFQVIQLRISGGSRERKLSVRLRPFVWEKATAKFVEDKSVGPGALDWRPLALEEWVPTFAGVDVEDGGAKKVQAGSETYDKLEVMQMPPPTVPDRPIRTLAYRFMTLPFITRLNIARQLGLIADDEELREENVWKLVFERTRTQKLFGDLWEEVEKAHGGAHLPDQKNPFVETDDATGG